MFLVKKKKKIPVVLYCKGTDLVPSGLSKIRNVLAPVTGRSESVGGGDWHPGPAGWRVSSISPFRTHHSVQVFSVLTLFSGMIPILMIKTALGGSRLYRALSTFDLRREIFPSRIPAYFWILIGPSWSVLTPNQSVNPLGKVLWLANWVMCPPTLPQGR